MTCATFMCTIWVLYSCFQPVWHSLTLLLPFLSTVSSYDLSALSATLYTLYIMLLCFYTFLCFCTFGIPLVKQPSSSPPHHWLQKLLTHTPHTYCILWCWFCDLLPLFAPQDTHHHCCFLHITKPGLKNNIILNTITSVIVKNSEMLGGMHEKKYKARSLSTKIVNALTAKLEIGSPIAFLYLLGNPYHYTNQNYAYSTGRVMSQVLKAWKQNSDVHSDKVNLLKNELDYWQWMLTYTDYINWVTSTCINIFKFMKVKMHQNRTEKTLESKTRLEVTDVLSTQWRC